MLSFVPRVQARRVLRSTQLGYIGSRIAVSMRRNDLAMFLHRSKNWNIKDGKMVLIAHHLLEGSIGAYIEWIVNELMMTTHKISYKDSRLVMLPQMQ